MPQNVAWLIAAEVNAPDNEAFDMLMVCGAHGSRSARTRTHAVLSVPRARTQDTLLSRWWIVVMTIVVSWLAELALIMPAVRVLNWLDVSVHHFGRQYSHR